MHTTFEELLAPLNSFSEEQIKEIDEQSDSRELFFLDFTKKMLFALVMNIPSLRQLITDLSTNEACEKLGFLRKFEEIYRPKIFILKFDEVLLPK